MEEKYKRKFKLQEMAHVGNINQLSIDVYTDHEPIHFHVTKKDEFEVKIDFYTLKVLGYKWQKNGKEISSKEMKDLKKWLNEKSDKNKKITNYEGIKFFWDGMN